MATNGMKHRENDAVIKGKVKSNRGKSNFS